MSDDCCGKIFDGQNPKFKRVLIWITVINASMFLIEMVAGHIAQSQALQADALDFLGDSLTYAISFIVIGMSARIRAGAALGKALSLLLMGLWVLGSTIYQFFIREVPQAELMGGIAFLAFAANLASVLLLARWRNGDANVRSVWLCSRNDAIGNLIVIVAAAGVFGTSTAWPDLAVAIVMAGLFLTSSTQILRQGLKEWQAGKAI